MEGKGVSEANPSSKAAQEIRSLWEEAKSNIEEERVKTFLLRLPYDVWKRANSRALAQDMALHDYLVEVIKKHLSNF
ncbi:hypothetical protein [Thermodesulfatator indicus]